MGTFTVLTGEPAPDSRVRVDDVIAAGRARVRRRRGALVGACAALAVLVTVAGVAVAGAPRREPAHPDPTPSPVPSVSVHPSACRITAPDGRYFAFSRLPDPGC